MSADQRPWWASDDDRLDAGLDADPAEGLTDPVDIHRAARRGGAAGGPGEEEPVADEPAGRARDDHPGADDDGSWWVPATEAVTRLARDLAAAAASRPPGPADAAEHRIDACGVCPICVGLRALGEARPDLVAHLSEAARHLALAVRTVVDVASDDGEAAAPGTTDPTSRRARTDGLEHIDLD